MRPWNGLRFNHGVVTTNLVCIGAMRSPSDQTPALTSQTPPAVDSDYDSIQAAVMETVRGRWFLSEYARRNRNADTDVLLKAIGRIESFVQDQVQHHNPEPAPSENNDNRPVSSDEAPAAAPFLAPQDKLEAANAELVLVREHIRNIADSLIECGAPSFLTNDLKRRVEDVSQVCGQLAEIGKVAQPVEAVAPAAASMQDRDISIQRQDIEAPVQDETPDVVAAPQPRRDPFADIRALSDVEKIALFT